MSSSIGSVSSQRERLLLLLRAKALRRLDEPVRLASGAWSRDFVDAKEALAAWRDLRLASEVIVEAVADAGIGFDVVGGPTMGADALAVGIASVSDSHWFFVRKEPKGRGTRRLVEGARIGPGNKALLVDDVVTTGGSIIKALDAVVETGAEVMAAVTLADRGRQARRKFDELGFAYLPMTTYESLGIEPVDAG